MKVLRFPLILFWFSVVLYSCANTPIYPPPQNPDNICDIFRQNPEWYRNASDSYRRWQVPIPIMMSIVYYESGFQHDNRPERTSCLYFFPGPRPSSAYGYPQALDGTWEAYKASTGNRYANREDFDDALDFIGWYCAASISKCGIDPNDAYNLYLAYHEGHGGYMKKSFQKKDWLVKYAAKVQNRAKQYAVQWEGCRKRFPFISP